MLGNVVHDATFRDHRHGDVLPVTYVVIVLGWKQHPKAECKWDMFGFFSTPTPWRSWWEQDVLRWRLRGECQLVEYLSVEYLSVEYLSVEYLSVEYLSVGNWFIPSISCSFSSVS
ncbi:uncharacterized [Tachysurus ichikawai]